MKRHVVAILIGAWLMGTMVMWWVAAENFHTVDRVLSGQRAHGLEQRMEKLTGGDARVLFRHLASELNRYYFRVWELGADRFRSYHIGFTIDRQGA